jgi:hypothetical protein
MGTEGETRVVRLRRRGGVEVQSCDVYIGRALTQGGWHLKTSKWHNPFTVKDCKSRAAAIAKFEAYFLRQPQLLRVVRSELHGKVLGCWCAPTACHGDVLKRYAAMTNEELNGLVRAAQANSPSGEALDVASY